MGCGKLVIMRPRGKPAALEQRRHKAIELLQQKMLIVEVAAVVQASTSSVKRWRDAYLAEGDAGLNSIPNEGRPPRLNEKQRKQLTRILLKGARASGYTNDLWTCPRVAEVIQRLFGVPYHVDSIGKLLHRMGWSVQKPERRAHERDEAAIARWRQAEWPRIKKGSGTKS
jgi:transposase